MAWLIQKPPTVSDRHERYLIRLEGDRVETTPQPLLARRFASAQAARMFAIRFDGLLDDWRVVRR